MIEVRCDGSRGTGVVVAFSKEKVARGVRASSATLIYSRRSK